MSFASDRSRWLRLGGPALLVSLGAHALLVLALWVLPGPQDQAEGIVLDTRVSLDCVTLHLDPVRAGTRAGTRGHDPDEDAALTHPDFVATVVPPQAPETSAVLPNAPTPSGGPAATPRAPQSYSPGGGGAGLGLFPVPDSARSVVFVLDRSLSMGIEDALAAARKELLASLAHLSPATRFQVIPYNLGAEPLCIHGRRDLLPADAATVEETIRLLAALQASGGTNHVRALQRGLSFRPDVLYLVTDAGDLSAADVEAVRRFNQGRTCIHAIELTRHTSPREASPLARLAEANRGTYRHVILAD